MLSCLATSETTKNHTTTPQPFPFYGVCLNELERKHWSWLPRQPGGFRYSQTALLIASSVNVSISKHWPHYTDFRVVLDTVGVHFQLPVVLTFPFQNIFHSTRSSFASVCENTQKDSTYYRHSLGEHVTLSGRPQ